MRVELTEDAARQVKKLPKHIQQKVRKTVLFLARDPHHPSLHSRKMAGTERFEARIDYHYRLTYIIKDDTIYVRTIGMHNTGLGKK